MSFYKKLLTAVAVMSFATAVFAEEATNTNATPATPAATAQPAAPAHATVADATTTEVTSTTTTTSTDAATTASAGEKVNINKATAKELMKVKGLNAAKAKAIVAYRKKHGDFKSVDDLRNVKGFKKMKDKTFSDVEANLSVE